MCPPTADPGIVGGKIKCMPKTMTTAPLAACRRCGRSFAPEKPWWHTCARCFRRVRRPFAVARSGQMAGQLSLADTPEWAAAVSSNVYALRPRRST